MNKAEFITGMDLSIWEVNNPIDKDQYYNCDAVIEAYIKGGSDRLKTEEKVLFNQFSKNIDKAKQLTIELLAKTIQSGFNVFGAYIKLDSFEVFESLISVPEADFVKNEFLSIYQEAINIEDKNNDDLYQIIFSFIPVVDDEFENNIQQDGYIIKFKRNS